MAAVLPMREYTGTEPLKKISNTVAVDSNGQRYRTHSGVKHPGAGERAEAKLYWNASLSQGQQYRLTVT